MQPVADQVADPLDQDGEAQELEPQGKVIQAADLKALRQEIR